MMFALLLSVLNLAIGTTVKNNRSIRDLTSVHNYTYVMMTKDGKVGRRFIFKYGKYSSDKQLQSGSLTQADTKTTVTSSPPNNPHPQVLCIVLIFIILSSPRRRGSLHAALSFPVIPAKGLPSRRRGRGPFHADEGLAAGTFSRCSASSLFHLL